MTQPDPSHEAGLRALLEARLAGALQVPAPGAGIARRADVKAPVPLSATQRSMWLQAQYSPADTAYNIPFVLRLRGALDRAALLGAIGQVVARHEVLHSVIVVGPDGEPAAVLRPGAFVPVDEREIAAEGLGDELHREIHRPFDLAYDLPVRAAVFTLGADHHVLAMTFHHVAADAYSRAAVLEDLSACYRALAHSLPLPTEPRVHYADYVSSDLASQAVDDDDLAWWKDNLAGLPPVLELPGGGARALPPWPAGSVDVDFDDELRTLLRDTAAASGCTLFMLLLAGLNVLLAKACGATDIVVGTPESGRHHEDVRDMPGCFVTTLAIRTDLDGDPTGEELLGRVREAALDCFAHTGAPFERVVGALNPDRDPRISPVFQVLLNVYDGSADVAGFAGLDVEEMDVAPASAKFDLAWHVVDRGPQGLRASLVYRTDLLDREIAERLACWFPHVLRQLLTDLRAPIGAIVLEHQSGPALRGPRPQAPSASSAHAEIGQWAVKSPDATAVVAADGVLTHRELDDWADDIAWRLREAGVRAGQPVGILLGRGVRLPAAIIGVLKASGYYVPIDPGHPPERIAGLVADAGIRTLISEPGAGVPDGVHHIVLDESAPPGPVNRPMAAPGVSRSDLAYAVYTSGSTGKPKGVAVEHGSLLNYLGSLRQLIGEHLSERPSFALVSTIAADLGLTNVFGALCAGGTLHLFPQEDSVDPEAFARRLRASPVEVIKMVPSQLEMLAAHGDLAGVLPRRLLILAGEACPWDLIDRIRAVRPDLAVQVHYGPTETTVSVLGGPVDDIPEDRRGSVAPLGRPMAGADCYVVDVHGRPVPPGVAGELLVAGPGVARGYLGRADLTRERFVPDPVDGRVRCYRTGDRVRVRTDGRVEFLGRLDDQIKIRGFRVELGEVLARVRAVPGIREAVVLPVGTAGVQRLVAWVTGRSADPDAIRAELRRWLPDYMIPAIVVLGRLPLTANGKVDRSALPIPDACETRRSRPPRSETEKAVAAVWEDVLGITGIGAMDDFFALGGDSFLALRTVRALDPALRMVDLLARPTVHALAGLLDGAGSPGPSPALLYPLTTPEDEPHRVTLICLPYAGGVATAYRPLADALGSEVAVLAAELPGHDSARPDEALLPWESLVEKLATETAAITGPVAIYGHSAGTALAVALANRLEARGTEVVRVIVGAQLPVPQEENRSTDEEYRQALRDSGGLSDDLDDEVERVLVRAARHDVEQARRWFTSAHEEHVHKLSAPLLCVVGAEDPGTRSCEDLRGAWQHLSADVDFRVIPGAGHYFVKHQAKHLAVVIENAVGAAAAPTRSTRARA
jgi:amino acid adenylation domain-containing protein